MYIYLAHYVEKKSQLCMHKSFINVSRTKHFVMIATPMSYIQNDTNSNLCINMLHHNNITIGFFAADVVWIVSLKCNDASS